MSGTREFLPPAFNLHSAPICVAHESSSVKSADSDRTKALTSNHRLSNILIVSEHFWPETFRINDVVQSLGNAGINVTVLTGQPNYPDGIVFDGYKASGLGGPQNIGTAKVFRLPVMPIGTGSVSRKLLSYFSFLLGVFLLSPRILKNQQFDIILHYGVSPLFLALGSLALSRRRKVPLALWLQDLWPGSLEATGYTEGTLLQRLLGKISGFIYRRCDLILIPSRAFEPHVRHYGGSQVPCIFHPNPADSILVDGIFPQNDTGTFEIVLAGNLGRALGLETVVKAAQILADDAGIRFRIVGSGSRSRWLTAEVARLKLDNVVLQGRLPPERMPAIFAASSALLLSLTPAPAMSKTVPSKLATYLACARPLLVSADGETARIVSEAGAGLCAAAGDAEGLAAAIRQLRNMAPEDRARMASASRAYCKANFDPDTLTRALIENLESVPALANGRSN